MEDSIFCCIFLLCIFLIEFELRWNMVLGLNHFQCQWSDSHFGSGITSQLIFYIGCWKMQTSSTIKTCQYFVSLLLWNMQKMCYPSLAQLFIFVVFSAEQQSPPPVWLQFTTYAKWQHFWWWQLEAEIANLQPYYMQKYYPSLFSAETILYHPFVESHDPLLLYRYL